MDGAIRQSTADGEDLRVDRVGAREAAFRDLADRHLLASYRLARAILGDMAEAEDATHDSFEAAWRKWSTLRDPSRFEAWFQRILVNTCRNRLRHGGRRQIVDISAHVAAVEDAAIVAVDERSVLREAIAGLQPDDRIVLALRFSHDLTVDQIADAMGLRPGTVKSRLHHAIRRLRDRLDMTIVPGEHR